MLAMMLPCLGAWAQPQTSDAPTNGEWAANTTWFLITNGQGYLVSKNIADNNGNLKLSQTTTTEATDDLLWCVVGSAENGYTFYNKAAGTDKILGLTGAQANARATFVTTGTANYVTAFDIVASKKSGYYCMKEKGSNNNYWNRRGEYLAYWNDAQAQSTGDNGSAYLFTPVNLEDIKEFTYQLTDNAGNVFEGTHKLIKNSTKVVLPQFDGVKGNTVSNYAWSDDIYTATITFPFPVSKVDGTTNWTFIYTGTVSSAIPYLYVNDSEIVVSKSNHANNGELGYLPSRADEIKKWMWAIYPTLTDNKFTFTIKNAATNKFVPGGNATTTVTVSNEAGVYSWGPCTNSKNGFYLANNTNVFFGANSGSEGEQKALLWNKNSDHQGCNLEFTVPVYTANCRLTDNSGNEYRIWKATFNYTVEEGDFELPNITGVPTSLINNGTWNDGVCSATINFPFAVTNGEKINPTFICTYGNDTFKWKAIGTGIKTVKNVSATSANIAEHLWEIIPDFNNGAFKFQIRNLATGTYINSTSNGNTHDEGKVSLSETASDVTFESNGFKLSTGKFLSIGSSSGSTGAEQVLGTWSSHTGTTLCFPIAKYTVEVGDAGYASLYTPVAGTFAGEVKTYAIIEDGIVNGYANLTELTGVAANQGAIVEAAPGTYTFTAGEVSSDWNGNLLTGTSVNTLVNESAYVLALVDGTAALALAELNMNEAGEKVGKETGTHFLNNAGKAYLPASAVSTTAQALRFNFGGNTTAIESVLNNGADANAPIYDLTGRRVVNVVKGGIYIQNGKKFIVK